MNTISIITTTFNSSCLITSCLQSVRDQTLNAEQIIIDGLSKDDTLNIVRFFPHVSKIVSESDHGIYDAMNKGLALASGEVIGILNSDDYYADNKVLQRVAEVFSDPSVDTCYGDLQYILPDFDKVVRYWRAGKFKPRSFYWGWMPPHPTFFVRRRVYERYGLFNLDLGSAADYELMLRFLVKHQVTTAYIPHIQVKMRTGGASNASLKNRIAANRMDRKAWEVNGLKPYPWTILAKPLRKIGQFF